MIRYKKTILASLFLFGLGLGNTQAQCPTQSCDNITETSTLGPMVDKDEYTFKTHFGIIGGAGVSNFLNNGSYEGLMSTSEGQRLASVAIAPRPEAQLGIFYEAEYNCRFALRASVMYTMRAIPKPTFNDPLSSIATAPTYSSIYLNGLTAEGVFFFQPVDRFRIGLGLETTTFFITKRIADGMYNEYVNEHVNQYASKLVLSYRVGSRTEISTYATLGNSDNDRDLKFNNISGGVMVNHRLWGKAYKVQEETYQLEYTK